MMTLRRFIQGVKKPTNEQILQELTQQLVGKEHVFCAPPLTPELTTAIELISPHLKLGTDETSRMFWEADQNGACWSEYETLQPLFRTMPKPLKVLEIGPGMGRSLVFFSKKLGWKQIDIHAYEGEGTRTKYKRMGPRFEDSFCGNIKMLRYVLEYNDVRNVTIHNASDVKLAELPGPYDFLYSFYSIGFHWSLEHFLDDILSLMHERSVAVFTVPQEFTPFSSLSRVSHKVLTGQLAWPKGLALKLLVLSKQPLDYLH